MTRDEIAHKEATQDPIFLFQEAEMIVKNLKSYELDEESEIFDPRTGDYPSLEDLIDEEILHRSWRTTGVCMSREEGVEKGSARPYAYGEQDKGWRVYCVPAFGELVDVLKKGLKK